MNKYIFSIETDLNNNVNTGVLHAIINDNIELQSKFKYIETCGDELNIWFEEILTNSEQIILSNIIQNYTYEPEISKMKISNYQISNNKTSSMTYTKLINFIFDPIHLGQIIQILFSGYTMATQYSVRLYNTTEKNIVAEGLFTNTVETIQNLGQILNQPQNISNIEVQLKRANVGAPMQSYVNVINIYSL